MPVYLVFLQVAKKLQLALHGSNLPTLLGLVKPHNTSCEQGFPLASGTCR